MALKRGILVPLLILILLVTIFAVYFLSKSSGPPQLLLAKATRREMRVNVSTNGIIEPADRSEVYASVDGLVVRIPKKEGSEVARGDLLMQLEAGQIRATLADAKAGLLRERRQARIVTAGPAREETDALDASIGECEMQLGQLNRDLAVEESLYSKGATARSAVESLRKQRDLLQLRAEALKKKKQDLQLRYSPEEKEWEQDKVAELTRQVQMLEQQLQMESVFAPRKGLIYSLPVKKGSYVTKGQLLAQIYQPGRIILRAYVDEPDLGRIRKGQQVLIEWDGLPDRRWTGIVDKPASQVVPLNNRSVGNVICVLDGQPEELIPNLNVRVEIVAARKANALVVPRAAVFNRAGQPTVLLSEGSGTAYRPVTLGLVTPEEVEIEKGIADESSVVLNHGEAATK